MKFFKLIFNQYVCLAIILALGLAVRLYKIDSPIADWHSWRQADTAAVSRNFIKEGFNPFYPKGDDMSGIAENPIPNPGRFRFVEFPIYNIAVYPFYLFFGVSDKYSRLVSVLFSLGSLIFIFLIAKRYLNTATALMAALIFALLPYNIYFSRTTLPEPTFVLFALGMVYFVGSWIDKNSRRNLLLAFTFTATAFLIKPWAAFFAPPLLYEVIKKEGGVLKIFKRRYILFAFFALLPFAFWRLWMLQQPEGIPASNWLLNGDGIRFRPAFWWWLVSERMGHEILAVTGFALFVVGLLSRPFKGSYFLHLWVLSMFLYFSIFATGNVRHDYYQIPFIPIAVIMMAFGFANLIRGFDNFIPRFWTILMALFLLPLTFYFGWTQVKGLYQINNPAIVEAGKEADRILPKNARVVTPYNGDTAFLYQTNRAGWPVTALPLAQLTSKYDVSYYISTSKDAKTAWVMRHYNLLRNEPDYVIADLNDVKAPLTDPKDPEP